MKRTSKKKPSADSDSSSSEDDEAEKIKSSHKNGKAKISRKEQSDSESEPVCCDDLKKLFTICMCSVYKVGKLPSPTEVKVYVNNTVGMLTTQDKHYLCCQRVARA